MKTPRLLAACALLALAACETAAPGLTVPEENLDRLSQLPPDALAPDISPRATLQAFENYCGRFPANPAGTARAVLADGYFLLGSGTRDGLEMYASEGSAPMVATGSRDGSAVCMVMVQRDPGLGAALAAYVQQRAPGALGLGSMQFGADVAQNIWVTQSTPPVLYFTLVQQDPILGPVEAVALVTE